MQKFTNKHNVKISTAERRLFNSVKGSIRRQTKMIDKILQPITPETYLRKKQSQYTPTIKKQSIHSFTSKKEFNDELSRLIKLRNELLPNRRKYKGQDELPKRFQKELEAKPKKASRVGKKKPHFSELKRKDPFAKLTEIPYINRKNAIYRENMITAIDKTMNTDDASLLKDKLKQLTESEFMQFIVSRPNETISYVYYGTDSSSARAQSLYNSLDSMTKWRPKSM